MRFALLLLAALFGCAYAYPCRSVTNYYNSGTITLQPYNNSMDACYLLNTYAASTIINFAYFQTEQNFDFLTIYDSATTLGNVVTSLTGSVNPTSFTVSGPVALVQFHSDSSVVLSGFSFDFYGSASAARAPNCARNLRLTAPGNVTMMPYSNYQTCSWFLSTPLRYLVISVSHFDTEECCDSLSIYSGTSAISSNLVVQLKGNKPANASHPWVYVVAGGSAYVSFNSDSSIVRSGFDLQFYGTNTRVNVNECSTGQSHCDPYAHCIDTVSGYMCVCNAGYTGTGQTCYLATPSTPYTPSSSYTYHSSSSSFSLIFVLYIVLATLLTACTCAVFVYWVVRFRLRKNGTRADNMATAIPMTFMQQQQPNGVVTGVAIPAPLASGPSYGMLAPNGLFYPPPPPAGAVLRQSMGNVNMVPYQYPPGTVLMGAPAGVAPPSVGFVPVQGYPVPQQNNNNNNNNVEYAMPVAFAGPYPSAPQIPMEMSAGQVASRHEHEMHERLPNNDESNVAANNNNDDDDAPLLR